MKLLRVFTLCIVLVLAAACGTEKSSNFPAGVPELSLPFSTEQLKGVKEIDTSTAKELGLTKVIDMPEAWNAAGKISRTNWTGLVYNYSNESENNWLLAIFNEEGKNTGIFELQINRPLTGELLPASSEIKNDSIISRYFIAGEKPVVLERIYTIDAEGKITPAGENVSDAPASNPSDETGVLKTAKLPLELSIKNFAVMDMLTQKGVEEIHGKDENMEYIESWMIFVMNNQKQLVDEAILDENTRYVYGVIDLYKEPAFTATLFRYTNPSRGDVVYYVTTLDKGSNVISKQKILDPMFFATGEGADYTPVIKVRFETDKHFSVYLKSDVETREEKFHIDESGKIIKY